MIEGIEYTQWASYFKDFNRRNRWRPTRLLILNRSGAEEAECGMPFVGVSIEYEGDGAARIHIMLGDHDATDPRHQTYTITAVRRVKTVCGMDGYDEALEIEDEQGETNLLRFEPLPAVSEMRQ